MTNRTDYLKDYQARRARIKKDFATLCGVAARRVAIDSAGVPYLLSEEAMAEVNEKIAAKRASEKSEKHHTKQQLLKLDVAHRLLEDALLATRASGKELLIAASDLYVPFDCPVFKRELTLRAFSNPDWAPTLLLIKPSLGWVPRNVVVVSKKAARVLTSMETNELVGLGSWLYHNVKGVH